MRRGSSKVSLEEEVEEVHDGDESAGPIAIVDADQRGGISLREGEEEVGERLVGVDDKLGAEGLELGGREGERQTLEMKVLMGKSKTAMSRKSSLMRSVRWNTPSKLSRVRERGESHRRHR